MTPVDSVKQEWYGCLRWHLYVQSICMQMKKVHLY